MNRLKIYGVIAFILIGLGACQTYKAVKMLSKTEASQVEYVNGDRSIRFIGAAHVAKPEFYEDIVNKITADKNEGYVLFYEWVDFEDASDTCQRKIRRMVGMVPTPANYAKTLKPLIDRGYKAQNNDDFLGLVNKNDYNADVSAQFIVDKYEEKYGPIELTESDYTLPLDSAIEDHLPEDRMYSVILDERNKYLADQIHKSEYKKITVLYGAKHEPGLVEELNKLNSGWKKKK